MKKNKQNLFSEDIQKSLGLSDESVKAIEESFRSKIDLEVVAALLEQEEVYAEKLNNLMETVDQDRTLKLKKIMEAFDKDKTAKLVKVIKKYEREQQGDLLKFKKQLTESVSAFLDEFLKESVPTQDIKEAVRNKTAINVLENMRKVFAIDLAVMKESVAAPIMEGKQELDKLRKENEELRKNVKFLTEEKDKSQINLFLEAKTSKYPEAKRNFLKKALGDKSLKFIKENFDYTVRLFEKQEKKQLEVIKEEALQNRKHKPDFVKEEIQKSFQLKTKYWQAQTTFHSLTCGLIFLLYKLEFLFLIRFRDRNPFFDGSSFNARIFFLNSFKQFNLLL